MLQLNIIGCCYPVITLHILTEVNMKSNSMQSWIVVPFLFSMFISLQCECSYYVGQQVAPQLLLIKGRMMVCAYGR